MGKRKSLGLARGTSSVSSPCHSRGVNFPTRTSRWRQLSKVLVRYRVANVRVKTGSRIVARSAVKTQRSPNLEARGNSIPPLRLKQLRLGSRVERLLRGARFLVDTRYGATYHLQGAQGSQVCHQVLSARAQRKKAPTTRGQPVCDRRAYAPHIKIKVPHQHNLREIDFNDLGRPHH